eukprot:5294056-Amphidinium_carterae.2
MAVSMRTPSHKFKQNKESHCVVHAMTAIPPIARAPSLWQLDIGVNNQGGIDYLHRSHGMVVTSVLSMTIQIEGRRAKGCA